MSRVEFSGIAKDDLDDIWLHIALDNQGAADRLIDRLVEATLPLEDFSEMGVARPELGDGIRLPRGRQLSRFLSATRRRRHD